MDGHCCYMSGWRIPRRRAIKLRLNYRELLPCSAESLQNALLLWYDGATPGCRHEVENTCWRRYKLVAVVAGVGAQGESSEARVLKPFRQHSEVPQTSSHICGVTFSLGWKRRVFHWCIDFELRVVRSPLHIAPLLLSSVNSTLT